MMPNRTLSPPFLCLGLAIMFLAGLLGPSVSQANPLSLQSYSLRAHIAEQTVLGQDATEDFEQFDISANFTLPWQRHAFFDFSTGTGLITSAGLFRGAAKNALVVLAVPTFYVAHRNTRIVVDIGAGGALLTRHRFGTQDFGGPFQFALTLGVGLPLYQKLGIGYRFLHYSDAGLNGSDTTGADMHTLEVFWRF